MRSINNYKDERLQCMYIICVLGTWKLAKVNMSRFVQK